MASDCEKELGRCLPNALCEFELLLFPSHRPLYQAIPEGKHPCLGLQTSQEPEEVPGQGSQRLPMRKLGEVSGDRGHGHDACWECLARLPPVAVAVVC